MPEPTDSPLRLHPSLGRFNPLRRIFFFDDFDSGFNGWGELIGNHDGNLDNVRPVMADMRPPQLSTMTYFDIGTHGPLSGTFALKLATRPKRGHMAQAIKRTTFARLGHVQLEMYFAVTSEQTFGASGHGRSWDGNFHPSESEFGDFTVSNDICIGEGPGERAHCALRYVNANDTGDFERSWFYKTSVQPTTKMVRNAITPDTADYHVTRPGDWARVPDGSQSLCVNELPSKINWHYLRWQFDTRTLSNVELQVNDLVMDLRALPVPRFEHAYSGLTNLLNFCLDVRSNSEVRNFLYVDSLLVSVDW